MTMMMEIGDIWRERKRVSDMEKQFGLVNADCLDAMKRMPDNSIDAIVTDPPYGINFMNKKWDSPGGMVGQMATGKEKRGGFAYGGSHSRGYKDCDLSKFQEYMTPLFQEMLRIAKPGAHLLAFGGTRTYHRLACAIEDAGWEVRDCLGWIYSSGMPKSMDISKAIDKKLGAKRATREAVGDHEGTIDFGMKNRCPKCGKPFFSANPCTCPREDLVPITEEAKKWSGWGTCLKPAFEPIVLARKPVEGTIADNVLKWGVGGLNIDECRVESDKPVVIHSPKKETLYDSGHNDMGTWMENRGRFPANLIHDGSDEFLEVFPNNVKGGTWNRTKGARPFNNNGEPTGYTSAGSDTSIGSAARFFYCPKASKKEKGKENSHPTVKPIELMKYLVKLVAPKGSLVLDPFMGSGSTGVAAIEIGRRFLGIEKEPEYFKIAENRLANAKPEPPNVV